MPVLHATLNVCGVTFPVLKLRDRSKRPVREVKWCLQKQLGARSPAPAPLHMGAPPRRPP